MLISTFGRVRFTDFKLFYDILFYYKSIMVDHYLLMTTNKMQLFLIYLLLVCSTCFVRLLRPSSGAYNCTYSCKYSCMLVMMDEGIAQNIYSRLEVNKSRIVASCWSSFIIILVMHGHMSLKKYYIDQFSARGINWHTNRHSTINTSWNSTLCCEERTRRNLVVNEGE
jgi:hypothetical protein